MMFLKSMTLVVVISVPSIGLGQDRPGGSSQATSAVGATDDIPEQKLATQRGLAAKEQQDWPLAVKYFREALAWAPGDPDALLRLALAYDKGGRPVPAIVAFRAYLAAAPRAENAETVRERITSLEVAVESQIGRLLRTAQEAAELIPDTAEKSARLGSIAEIYAEAENFSEALRVAATCPFSTDQEAAYKQIAARQSQQREFTAAFETAARIRHNVPLARAMLDIQEHALAVNDLDVARRVCESIPDVRISIGHAQAFAWANLAELQAKLDDLEGARLTLERIPADRHHRPYALGWVADAVGNAHPEAARKLLLEAREAALNLPTSASRSEILQWLAGLQVRWGSNAEANATVAAEDSPGRRVTAYLYVARKQRESGDDEEALASVARALEVAEQVAKRDIENDRPGFPIDLWRCEHYRTAVELQLAAGNVAAARDSADRALRTAADQPVGMGHTYFLPDIAYAQARNGDATGALQTVARIVVEDTRNLAYDLVVKARCDAGDVEVASAIAERIPAGDTRRRSRAGLAIAAACVKRHDLASASEVAARIQFPHAKADVYSLLARSYLQAGREAEARESLRRALAAAEDVSKEYDALYNYNDTLRELAILQARLDDLAGARKTAAKMSDVLKKLNALIWIAGGKELASVSPDDAAGKQIEEIGVWVKLLYTDPHGRWTNLDAKTADWDRTLGDSSRRSSSQLVDEVIGAARNLLGSLTTVRSLEAASWVAPVLVP